jgi:hypothetical protein
VDKTAPHWNGVGTKMAQNDGVALIGLPETAIRQGFFTSGWQPVRIIA